MIFFRRVFSELKGEMKNIRCTALPKIQRTSIDIFFSRGCSQRKYLPIKKVLVV